MLTCKNKNKILKMALCLFFAFLLSINSFAAIVSDNDGAAFVTKAEFEALKKDFADQITNYNSSIDSKIDGAIAQYLAGTRLSKKEIVKLDTTFNWVFPIICMNAGEWNQRYSKYYSYEMPDLRNISLTLRKGGDWSSGVATNLDYDSRAAISSNVKSDAKAVAFAKNWYVTPVIYSELLELSDVAGYRTISTTSIKCYKLKNVGKGRHVVTKYSMVGGADAGHLHNRTSATYWGYTGVLGMGVSGGNGTRNTFTTSSYANWTPGTWTRINGDSKDSNLGWGVQYANAFVLPAASLNLNGARTWASTYTASGTNYHEKASIPSVTGGNTKYYINWRNDQNNHRSWIYTGNSDAPATSIYGWYFNCDKPSSATENFAGYIMNYENDLGLVNIDDNNWAGFHSWTPHWYWRYTAGGSIGTAPSTSEFSKLPAKQIFYNDSENNTHYLDEGLFLFNMPGVAEEVEFDAKWIVLDSTVTSEQKIVLKISSSPFGVDHDSTKDLKYTIDGGTTEASGQQVVCGSSKKIKVKCDEHVKQLYMMWTPVTSGTYIGLSELSDFTVSVEQ